MNNRRFYSIFIIIFITGLFLRFYNLAARPVHYDEGVIGWLRLKILDACMDSGKLFQQSCEESYSYNPDYHGSFPFILGAWVFRLLGTSDYTLRLPGALFNAATILLLLPLRKHLKDYGTLTAATLLSFSPTIVYYSHHAYHDNFFLFFTVGALVCIAKYLENNRAGWLYTGAAAAAILFATKETAYILLAIASIYAALTTKKEGNNIKRMLQKNMRQIITAAIIYAAVNMFLYSNTLAKPMGALDALKGASFWADRSTNWSDHFRPPEYYLLLLTKYETPLVLLAIYALKSLKTPFSRWCAWWSLSTLVIYSLTPYKMPWLSVNIILPMALLAGTSTERILSCSKNRPAAALIVVLLIAPIWTTWKITYLRYSDPSEPLVYAASLPAYDELVKDVKELAGGLQGKQTPIAITLEDYWPLPWSLREYAIYRPGVEKPDAPIIIGSCNERLDKAAEPDAVYETPKKYEIRPSVFVCLYSKKTGR